MYWKCPTLAELFVKYILIQYMVMSSRVIGCLFPLESGKFMDSHISWVEIRWYHIYKHAHIAVAQIVIGSLVGNLNALVPQLT